MHFVPRPGINRVEQDFYYILGPSVSGTVRNSNGTPLSSVKVLILGATGKLLATLHTDEHGFYHEYSFKLADEPQSLIARLWKKLVGESRSLVVKLPDCAQQQTVTLKAKKPAFADFSVQTEPKTPIYG